MSSRLLFILGLSLLLFSCRDKAEEYQIIKEPQGYHPMERVEWQFYVNQPLLHMNYHTRLSEAELMALEPYRILQSVIPAQAMPISLRRQIQTGNPPDLFAIWPDITVQELMSKDRLMDLSILLEDPEFASLFPENLPWEQVYRNGKIYGLPLSHHLEGLFYNYSLFEKNALEIPSTLAELHQLVSLVRQQGGIPFYVQKREDLSFFFQIMLVALAEKDEYKDPASFEGKRLYRKALQQMKALYDAGAFESWVIEQLSMVETIDIHLVPDRYAMVVQGSWFIPYLDGAMGDEVWGLAPFPSLNVQEAGCFIEAVGADTLFVSWKNRSEEETEALLMAVRGYAYWLNWLDEPGQNHKWPNSMNIARQEEFLKALILEKSSMPRVRYAIPPDFYWERYQWNQQIVNLLPAFLCGDLGLDEIFPVNKEGLDD